MSTPRRSATQVASDLVDALAQAGVAEVVVSPGSRNAPLLLAVAAHPGLRVHVRIDERTAAFLALGLARGSGRPAAVLCSSGTATASYHPAVLEADAAGVPLVVLTADRPPEMRDIGANQTTTQLGLYGGAVRWTHEVGHDDAGYLRGVVGRAVAEATRPWPGPVHLNIPLREPLLDDATTTPSPAEADAPAQATPRTAGSPGPDAEALLAGRRTLLVAGEGAVGGPRTLEVAGRLGIPVLAEPTSGLRSGPAALVGGHWLAATPDFVDAHRPEVVVLLGRAVLSRPIAALVAAAEEVVACDPLDRRWDPGRDVTRFVPSTFEDWADGVAAGSPEGWMTAWQEADATVQAVLDAEVGEGISELGATRALAAAVPDGGALVVASSLPIRHLNETMPVRAGVRVVGNRGLSGIDGFTSTAVGVALAHDGPTVALAGDLSVVHDMTGLVIGADEPMPTLPIVVLNNDGGGIFHLLPYGSALDEATFRRLFATPHGLPMGGLAMTMGWGHTTVDDVAELSHAVRAAWTTPGITLVEVPTDTPTETARYHRVREAVAAALRT